ncbi:MAG TPA: hypothetical protein VKX16_01410 [Chloroflexota bacterium]|nr:hypothetical protein [Chloroflexota bacterium]
MIGQIRPLGQRSSVESWQAFGLHAFGLVASAGLLGLGLGCLGRVIKIASGGIPLATPLGAVLLALALAETTVASGKLTLIHRQTPRTPRDLFGLRWAAFFWGVDLGQGWTTHVQSAAYYGTALFAFSAGSVRLGIALLMAYGAARAAPVGIALVAPARFNVPEFLDHIAPSSATFSCIVLACVAGLMLAGS